MLNFLPISQDTLQLFILVFIRTSVVLFMFPIFSSPVFPEPVKAGFCLILSLVIFPTVSADLLVFPGSTAEAVIWLAAELIIGFILGLIIRLFFAAVQLAGELISFQMGFAVINVLDPQSGAQISILDQFGYWLVLLVFLLLNGHHIMITALSDSFQLVGMGMLKLNSGLLHQVMRQTTEIFALAIKIGAPGIVSLLFVSAAFGLCAKFAPQMNILIAAFPVQIITGLIFFAAALEIIVFFTRIFVQQLPPLYMHLLRGLGGG